MRKIALPLLTALILFTCNQEEKETRFIELNTSFKETANVEITTPKAEGNSEVSSNINATVGNHIANMLLFSEDEADGITIDQAIQRFNDEAVRFKEDFEESAVVFEAQFDGEVTYQSSEIISIAITGYLNTGGAHGNTNITLYNFDAKNGEVIAFDNLINDKEAFTSIAITHFENKIEADKERDLSDYFFGDPYHLPANIGFTEEGVLLIYNQYEIASYASGITEYTIPFLEVTDLLLMH